MISAKMPVKSRYIPILKAKLAEFEALRELPAQIRQQVTPVIDRLVSITYSDGVTPNVSGITYDADGQRTAVTDATGTNSWIIT